MIKKTLQKTWASIQCNK